MEQAHVETLSFAHGHPHRFGFGDTYFADRAFLKMTWCRASHLIDNLGVNLMKREELCGISFLILLSSTIIACSDSGGGSGSPSSSSNSSSRSSVAPTPDRPLLTTQRVEAEDASLLGVSTLTSDPNASGSTTVGNIMTPGDGISLAVPQDTVSLVLGYSSVGTAEFSITPDGGDAVGVSLADTGSIDSYAEVSVTLEVDEGVDLTVTLDSDADVRLDYIDFEPTPFQVVETVADLGQRSFDGLSVDADGNIFVSGFQEGNILRVTPDGDVSTFVSGLADVSGSDFDSNGDLFVAIGGNIHKVDSTGNVELFGDEHGALIPGVWVDRSDVVYGTDWGGGSGDTVYSFTPDGTRSIHAQGGGLNGVIGVAGDGDGGLWVGNWSDGKIFDVSDGDNIAELVDLNANVNQIAFNKGRLYAPSVNGNKIFSVRTSDGRISLLGTGRTGSTDGHVLDASFNAPNCVAFSPDGSVMYVVDTGSGLLRKIHSGGDD